MFVTVSAFTTEGVVEVNLRLISLGIGLSSGAHDQALFFLSDDCGFLDVGRPF
jgi:hypothetical protein